MTTELDPTWSVDMRALLGAPETSVAPHTADDLDSPAAPPRALVGGRYRVVADIASGGTADVVRAVDELLEREVAVKLLREPAPESEDRARFLDEVALLAGLSHPGLVTLLDAGEHAGQPYLVMELVDGPPLSALLEQSLSVGRLASIGSQVAAALAYAHERGVVHRDVKPGNVLVREDGRVKLADFGIARLVGEHAGHTQTGVVVGSVHYLAPEQVAFERITPAVDVYGLGLLLLRGLTGRHAFEGPTIESALARLTARPEIPDTLPSGWRDLLEAMTRRAPGDRPTAAQVAERLAWLAGEHSASGSARVLPPMPMEQQRPQRTRVVADRTRLRAASLVTRLGARSPRAERNDAGLHAARPAA